jgi:hypothetical protein
MREKPKDLAMEIGASPDGAAYHQGQQVRAYITIEIPPLAALEITKVRANKARTQGLVLASNEGEMAINGVTNQTLTLWANTMPTTVVVTNPSDAVLTVDLWNCWRYGNIAHAWTGNAGIVVQQGEDQVTLQCSDGIGAIELTDFVVGLVIDA